MATLQTKTFDQIVQEEAAAIQAGSTGVLADFSIGSILRAAVQSFAAVVMWLQSLILQLLTTTRASTSTGADLDSWMLDYGLTRLAAVPASGTVTFARFTPTLQAMVPVGALVQSSDGALRYTVVADTTKPTYNPTLKAYVIPAGTASADAALVAVVAGTAGNALAGSVNTLGQAISGIDTVSNALALINGADKETDAAFRTRFVAYIGSLSKATTAAVNYSVTSLGQGLSNKIVEAYDYSGAYKSGYFYAVVDDGTGAPPSTTLAAASTAIDAVRACGIQFGVFGPTAVTANVALAVTLAAGYDGPTVRAAVQAAIIAYITALDMGQPLLWSRLYQVAYSTSPGVTAVTGLLVNGSAADVAATARQVIVPGTVTVS